MAILKQKTKHQTRVLSVRLVNNLFTEVEDLKRDAETAGFEFDASAVCADALSKAVKQARAELLTHLGDGADKRKAPDAGRVAAG